MTRLSVPVRVRSAADSASGIVEGVASVYNLDYPIGPRLNERIVPGAFDASIRERGGVVPVYLHHGGFRNGDAPIGHANVTSDDNGLNVEAQLYTDTDRARAVYNAMAAGAISEWSIGAVTPNESDVRVRSNPDGTRTEDVVRADLKEVSIVMTGANPGTSTTRVRDDSAAQIEQARAALAIIAKLIAGEANDLAEGQTDESYDIAELLDAYRQLSWFVLGEQAELDEAATSGYVLTRSKKHEEQDVVRASLPPEMWDRISEARVRELLRSSAPGESNTQAYTDAPTASEHQE